MQVLAVDQVAARDYQVDALSILLFEVAHDTPSPVQDPKIELRLPTGLASLPPEVCSPAQRLPAGLGVVHREGLPATFAMSHLVYDLILVLRVPL